MFDFHEKRKIRSVLYSKFTVAALFILTFLLLISVYNRYVVAKEMGEKLEAKQTELEALKNRAAALETKVRYLEDERGIEEELRNRFDVVREGEQTVILIDPPEEGSKKNTVPGIAVPPNDSDSGPETFFDRFKFW